MLFHCFQQAVLDPNLPPVNLDELEQKIHCQGLALEADESTLATPTPCHALPPHCQLPDIPHHPQPTLHAMFHPGPTTIAPYTMCLLAKPLDPAASTLPCTPTPASIPPCPTPHQSTQPCMLPEQMVLKHSLKPSNPSKHWAKCQQHHFSTHFNFPSSVNIIPDLPAIQAPSAMLNSSPLTNDIPSTILHHHNDNHSFPFPLTV